MTARRSLAATAAHTLVVISLVLLFALLVVIRDALLFAFVAVIIAVLLDTMAAPISRHVGAPRSLALGCVVVAVIAILAGTGWLVGAQVHAQLADLLERLPGAVESAEQRFGFSLESVLNGEGNGWLTTSALPSIASLGQVIIGAITGFVLAVVTGIFLAAQPTLYRRGLVMLFPKSQHDRVEGALAAAGKALRQWLVAQGMAMAAVGLMAGIGAWLLGLPAPLAIGLLAGLLEFIPLIGPVVAALPALILALSESVTLLIATLALFFLIQQIEGNLITPIAQQKAARLPAALLLLAVVGCGTMFGFLGVLVAAPLAVVTLKLVQRLYVEDTLNEETEQSS